MVGFARIILGDGYDSQFNPGDFSIETLPIASLDYEPMETAWKTALAIMHSSSGRQALSKLAAALRPTEDSTASVDCFIADLSDDQHVPKYLLLADGRLALPVLGEHKRPLLAIHLNKQYVRSIGATMGDEESRLRCLLATTIVHEFAHCFVTFLGYTERDVTPEGINHPSFAGEEEGQGESGRFLEWHLWGGALEWQSPDAGQLVGDLFLLDESSNARLVLRRQVSEIGLYRDSDTPLELGVFQLESEPNDVTYPGSEGFRGLRSFARSPNPLPKEMLADKLKAASM
ncbi:hypothetical protein Dda_7060 [Drechslerella dactyloides]|uniref:Uncharacterized protein n=1 Tax=Drechslerella dactyloides TaxID=74499 RepID=A0AAD6NIQ5_DREDA|nr:hypothetical protein Dda_7060 [Drechslerella dactyloides]